MEDLQVAIVNWLNKIKLSKNCRSFTELKDGIILFELLSRISPEHFDLEAITIDTQNNWGLRLGNLKRLKQCVDYYIVSSLKIPYEKINEVVLGNIARRAEAEDILKLFELVLFVILNCPMKEEFIRKIMDLSEKDQYSLMLMIKKIINKETIHIFEENEIQTREIQILRNAKMQLQAQVSELQKELNAVNCIKEQLISENEDIKLSKAHLQNELDNVSSKINNDSMELYSRLEKKLIEKSSMLEMSKQILESQRIESQNEINRLKDELDHAITDQQKLRHCENTLEKYKKKIESSTKLKRKISDIKKNNENMHQLIKKHQHEAESYRKCKNKLKEIKEELIQEKHKSEMLHISTECKEKQIVKLNLSLKEALEKIKFLENYIQEIKNSSNSSVLSDDTGGNRLELEVEIKQRRDKPLFSIPAMHNSMYVEQIITENHRLRSLLNAKKEKSKALKENIQMITEELNTKAHFAFQIINQLKSMNQAMSDKLQEMSESIIMYECDKELYKQTKYELDNLKSNHESLLSEIKKLYSEKDEMFKRCIEAREQSIDLNNKLHQQEFAYQKSLLNLKLSQERIKELETHATKLQESLLNTPTSNTNTHFLELEKEISNLKNENLKLKLQNNEISEENKQIVADKERALKMMEENNRDLIEKIKKESLLNSEQMIRDTEVALQKIQNDRDQIRTRLDCERKSSLRSWNKAIMIKDPYSINSEEVKKLKNQLADVLKENENLVRDNQELMICWKDSAWMVKELKRSMDQEAKRMQDAIRMTHHDSQLF
ncbi:hypothetical protein SteCoe_21502 [Stentor coeruleus]|uniref:Calponin-homology (CH) domain-containing protein n=1 Tax=Stentor coeruleus TaxID=5963 RepID=A0A1R2BPV4_9CILI|nr:hypothetical protein SteCoe_21502 [Stentor coeruleus]